MNASGGSSPLSDLDLTPTQQAAVTADGCSFLIGPAGSGKSTALQRRLLRLLEDGEPSYTILVIVAETAHALSVASTVRGLRIGPHGELKITTFASFAKEMITLMWPLLARPAGFSAAHQPPAFLGYDLAQILMWKLIEPALASGMFAGLRLRPQQIVSQILDTLNRAALNQLSLDEVERRQYNSWIGEHEHLIHLRDAAAMAREFRNWCLANNLLDLSLVVEVFDRHLVHHPELRQYFSERFRHLIVDNLEEQTPAGQSFVESMLEAAATAAIAMDSEGGYKRFLGADPDRALTVSRKCRHTFSFEQSFTTKQPLLHLANHICSSLGQTPLNSSKAGEAIAGVISRRYRRDMVSSVVDKLAELLNAGTSAEEIAIITPYLDGSLRYSLSARLGEAGVPYRIVRRRSSPREEPRIRAWLTWLALAHPSWGYRVSKFDVAEAMALSISNLDPARAQLVSNQLYDQEAMAIKPITEIGRDFLQRIGAPRLELVEELRAWMEKNGEGIHTIGGFLSGLFNDLLALPRFQPEPDLAAAAVCDWLVRTADNLQMAAAPMGMGTPAEAGPAFIESIYQGLVSASPPDLGHPPDPQGITISTMYGFLISDRPVRWQVWLDIGATGWWDIPRQPLSNAFVLTRQWQENRQWTMADDFDIRNLLLSRIVRGLIRRCTEGVILASSDLDRRGFRQQGALHKALQSIIDKINAPEVFPA